MSTPPIPGAPTKKNYRGRHRRRNPVGKARRLLSSFSRQPSTPETDGSIDDQVPGPSSQANHSGQYVPENHPGGLELSAEAKRITENMLSLLREGESPSRQQAVKTELKHLLNQACQTDPINIVAAFVDHKGFNIVQRAVIKNNHDFIEYLLLKGYHISNIKRQCSSPLHLACKLGHSKVVSLLIDYGASLDEYSSACYPPMPYQAHPLHTPSSSLSTSLCCAYSEKHTPLYVAIQQDHLDVVKIIMTYSATFQPKIDFSTLECACKSTAAKSLAYLIQMAPQEACLRDKEGSSLLALAFEKSEACGRLLLESTLISWPVDVLTDCTGKQDTLLHVIYRGNCENILEMTRLTFQVGFPKSSVNKKDRNGNTALHILMKQVGRKLGYPWNTSVVQRFPASINQHRQGSRDEQVYETVCLLLDNGANLLAKNNSGESILHNLLQDSYYRRLYGMPSGYYQSILPEINRILELLLRHGAEVDNHTDQVSSPLTWFTQVLCSMDSSEVDITWPEILYTFKLFCKYGADPNMEDEKGISNISLMLTAVSRWLNQCTNSSELNRCSRALGHIQELIEMFFSHGLVPSTEVLDLCIKQVAILCNVGLIERDLLIGIRELLVTMFVHGIDPNGIHLVTEYADHPGVPCPLNSQFYLARAFIIHRHHAGMDAFFSLFEQSLEQENLNRFTRALCNILSTNFEDSDGGPGETSKCIQLLAARSCNPRSLKVLAKVQIVHCLRWQIKKWTPALPLPSALQRYVMNFHSQHDY